MGSKYSNLFSSQQTGTIAGHLLVGNSYSLYLLALLQIPSHPTGLTAVHFEETAYVAVSLKYHTLIVPGIFPQQNLP